MIKTLAQRFFSEEEQQQITRTVQEAEQRTIGEIVPMVVSASHDYPEAGLAGAAAIALPIALVSSLAIGHLFWLQHETLWLFLALLALFFPLGRLLMRQPRLLRPFIAKERAAVEVQRGALARFYSQGLQATREATGVLIYISVLERRVVILGDRGINEQLSPLDWVGYVDQLILGIREGRQAEALCAVITEIGALLHTHFPPRADDSNELGNLIIIDSDEALTGHSLVVR